MTQDLEAGRRSVNGISCIDVGDGPVTVFVHGVFTNALLWRNVVRALEDRRRCVVIDLPGHGRTPPMGQPSVHGWADAVSTVLRELDLWNVHLVGNDTGGAVVQLMLARDPDRLASVALTNCDTERRFPPRLLKPMVWAARAHLVGVLAAPLRIPWVARAVFRSAYRNPAGVPQQVLRSYLAPTVHDREGRRFLRQLLTSVDPRQLAENRPRLAECELPTALIWGTGDPFFDVEDAAWLHDVVPGARAVVEIPGARLFFPDENAAELVEALDDHWNASAIDSADAESA